MTEDKIGIIVGIDRKINIQKAVKAYPQFANMSHFTVLAIDKQLAELDEITKGAKCKS